MRSLFDHLDRELANRECDGSLQITLRILNEKQLSMGQVVPRFENAGGHCDGEVLANAEEKFLFAFPEYQ